MPTEPIYRNAMGIDLSSRVISSVTVAASPSAATETTIATLTIPSSVAVVSTVLLMGWAAFTVGTNGVSARLRMRQTNTSGSVVGDTGATTGGITATNLVILDVGGADTAPPAAGVYVLTLTIGSGSAASTVSGVQFVALVI